MAGSESRHLNLNENVNEERSDEEDQFSTPHEVYRRLVDIVNNETLLSDLLPFEELVIDCVIDQMEHMNNCLARVGSKLDDFCVEQHKIELERFAFIVNKYYRTRLAKIEANCSYLIRLFKTDRSKAYRLMSPFEIKYLDNYVSSIDEYFDEVFLSSLPPSIRTFKMINIEPNQANNTDYVFVKCGKKTVVNVDDPITGQESVEMEENGRHFLPYSCLKKHFESDSKHFLIL